MSKDEDYQKVHIVDIMKTMDNRVAMDKDTIKQFVPDAKLQKLTQDLQAKLKRANAAAAKRKKRNPTAGK